MNDRPLPLDKIEAVAALIAESNRVVVFTGAGVSTESGIPDFRSPGGIWSRFDPDDFTIDKFLYDPECRRKQWRFLLNSGLFDQAEPNEAHRAVAWLESIGKLQCVITQNVDDLHQRAGNDPSRVYELHGNMRWIKCLGCYERFTLGSILQTGRESDEVPSCPHCRGLLKPDVIFFGEALPEQTLREANRHAATCDLLIVIGSSLVVYPAAYIPIYAKGGGAKLVIINLSETPYDANADIVIHAPAGATMSAVVEALRKRLH
ncbi:MAG TPA: NAD-dependent deacylase [Syntrophales bacterium]|nr:NAD-dependent deacylase [Syntrophales bacterium]HOM08053.1 NAD-dependent deacylase [Syntrophales bacterium]HON99823.1 NAD-dependent deacylase [Syntrophales bacterium]HPC01460.1 NAD-dependent deacylase [Syntrophales bacterium]HPQ07476.1 NAD-dependent deacylase [Syntrophales bacterium]